MTVVSGNFEWDSEKDEANRRKHGFSFSEILDVFLRYIMTQERIAELQNRPIDVSDIPEVTAEQAREFYPRRLRTNYQLLYNLFDKENLQWLEKNGATNRVSINTALEKLRNGTLRLA